MALWTTDPPGVVARTSTTVTAVNTTVQTAVASLTLPGGTVKAGDLVRATYWCDHMNNSPAAVGYSNQFKIGATTVLDTGSAGMGVSASRFAWRFIISILIESPSAQRVIGHVHRGGAASWAVNSADPHGVRYNVAAESLAVDKVFALLVTMGTAHASADFVGYGGTLEVIRS